MHRFGYKTYYLDSATNEWVYIPQVLAGVTNRETLDETLDMSVMAINGISQKEPFEPITKFKREVLDYASGALIDTIYRYCASDVVVQTAFGAKQLFRHNITLIEPTKELERYVCDNLTITNPLLLQDLTPNLASGTYESKWREIPPNYYSEWYYIGTDLYYTPMPAGSILKIIPMGVNYVNIPSGINDNIRITENDVPSGSYITLQVNSQAPIRVTVGQEIQLRSNSTYIIRYHFENIYATLPKDKISDLTFAVISYVAQDEINYTTTKVCNRLFSLTPTRLASEKPKFKLSEDFAKKYENVNAPEFSFTQKTLFDALLEVGKSIQSIPYIKVASNNDKDWTPIDFQFVGGNMPYSLDDTPYSAYQDNWSCEQYCDCIDSTINNIMCSDVNKQGTLYEPYYGGSIEARVESGELTEDTVELITSMPIGKLHKVVIKGETIGTNDDYDITPFVYEKTNYDALYNVLGQNSKAFAVYYSYGQKNIKGLYYKVADAVSSALQKPAIQNIIAVVSGQSVNIPFDKLYYQIEYTPFINARLKQYKSNVNSTKNRSTLIFNQQTNIPDSRAYGSNMLGTVARLGNTAPIITYLLTDYSLIPHVGQLSKNGYYVSIVELEYWEDYIKCTVTMSKDFNRLSEYVGIKSYERFYEVDPTMALDRFVNIDDFVVFSTERKENNNSFITAYGIIKFADMFYKSTDEPVSIATVVNKESDGTVISSVALSASSLGFGNSIALTASYQDNYSASSQIISENVTTKTRLFGKPYQYADIYGRIDKCDITFSLTANDTNNNNYNYPDLAGINPLGQLVQINDLQLEKDSREKINITYQMHFVTDNGNIVIGQAMADNNSFIGANTNVPAKVAFLDKKIGTFESVLDYNTAIYIDWEEQLNGDAEKKLIDFGTFYAPVSCKAWAILDSNNNLMIGMNEAVNQGERTTAIIANFTRKK